MGDSSSCNDWFDQYNYDYQAINHGQAPPYSNPNSSSSSFGFSSDSMMITTITASNSASDHTLLLSPTSSTNTSSQLTPKGTVSKPIRRRSRVSKKTPITLLNANASNFRSLVQQFTGYSSSRSCGSQKGPINLNFQLGSAQNHSFQTTKMAPYSTSTYYQMQQEEQSQQVEQQRVNVYQGATICYEST
ncbi:VQ motif-containing protein 22-like [Mercurialis annua]|uniref:VQ motif-containing protein 22-like n=1 Tax=Mercurialis annua TaxID=3986 RepID=UPI00215F9690|nr:VQ motif-containing protein 22-like [Mercurialis annua]